MDNLLKLIELLEPSEKRTFPMYMFGWNDALLQVRDTLDKCGESGVVSSLSDRFDDDKFINNVCLSYRHDFGLLSKKSKMRLDINVKSGCVQ